MSTLPRMLGRYEVVAAIGRGTTGSLYRARDPRIGRTVAVKLLQEGYDSSELRSRFARGARAAGMLSHPNIIAVYDIGEHEGRPFIAMEYIAGETIAELIASRTPLPLTRKLQMIEEVCAGLAHAHESGIMHRDIKPANLMVGPEGTVKILDFGIARTNTSGLTLPGTMLGTLNYMSPEQIHGNAVDSRTDIFAVGAVLYELLSFEQAFPGKVHHVVLHQILSGSPVPLAQLCPDLDPQLLRIVDKALQKKAEDRFQTAEQLQTELATVRLGEVPEPEVPEPLPAVASSGTSRSQVVTTIWTPRDRTSSRGTRSRIDPATLAKQRARQIDEHLQAAEQACESGDYDAAIEACEQALRLDPAEPRATALLDRIQAAVNERQVQALLAEAREHLARGAIGTAADLVESASVLSAQHADVAELAAEIDREKAHERSDAGRTAGERARAALSAGDPDTAHTYISQALALAPDGVGLQEIKLAIEAALAAREEETRVRAVVSQARRQFIAGDHDAALQLLDVEPESNPTVATALEEFRGALRTMEERRRAEQERLERQQRVEALFVDARRAIEEEQFDDALAALDLARETDAHAPGLTELGDEIRHAQAAAQLREELARTVAAVAERLDAGDLAGAEPLLAEAARLGPADDRVRQAQARFDDAAATRARRDATEARMRESDEQAAEAAELLAKGDLDGAERRLRSAAGLNPDNPRLASLTAGIKDETDKRAAAEAAERRRQQIAELLRAASQPLQVADQPPDELIRALAKLDEALVLDPGNSEAQELKPPLEKALVASRELVRIRAEVNNARRRFANGKHFAALQLLESIRPAEHPLVVETLEDLRAKMRHLEDQQRADQAQLEREQRTAQLMADARAALAAQQFTTAVEALTQARELDPSVEGLSALLAQASAARAAQAARTLESERRTAEAAERFQQGDLAGARQLVEKAAALDPENMAAAALGARIRAAIDQHEAAEAAERAERQLEVDELVATATERLDAGDAAGAGEVLQSIIQKDPADPRSARLKRQIDTAIRSQQEATRRQQRLDAGTTAAQPGAADTERTRPAVPPKPASGAGEGRASDLLIGREHAGGARAAAPDTFRIPEPWVSGAGSKQPGLNNARLLLGGGGAVVVVLVILGVVFRGSWSSSVAKPNPPPTPTPVPGPAPEPAPEPPAPKTFEATLVAKYKFAVEFPDGKRAAATRQTLTLPAGPATQVRLSNPDVFLNQVISVHGEAGETKTVPAPAMSSLTVYNAFNESCEIFVDGRMVGFHPVTQSLVAGTHQVSLKCANGRAPAPKSVQVPSTQSATVAFTKNDKVD